MENASKALLIAAGMIIAALIMTLLVGLYNDVQSYYAQKHDMTQAEQTQKFNSRFENYNGNEIRGNELISVMNRIIDYNNLQSDMEGFKRIILNVDLLGHASELAYDGNATLFGNTINNLSNDVEIKRVAELSITLTSSAKTNIPGITDLKLQKLSSEIYNIVLDYENEESKIERAKKLTRILGYTIDKDDDVENIVNAVMEYHQFTQFKRTMFKCTEVSYDKETGRVDGMKFVAVEENGTLKMD